MDKQYKTTVNGVEKLATATSRFHPNDRCGTHQPRVEWIIDGRRHSLLVEGGEAASSDEAVALAGKFLESIGYTE